MKKIIFGIILVLGFSGFFLLFAKNASAPAGNHEANKPSQPIVDTTFNKKTHPIDQPDSIWWIVSKSRPLNPVSYSPTDLQVPKIPLRVNGGSDMRLRREATGALEKMFGAAITGGYNLRLTSGYRSYQLQVSVYNGYVQQLGQAGADKISARPGTSEHQTGLAADVEPLNGSCRLEECFGLLPEGIWLAANAYKYGFIVRYPVGKVDVTGYQYEPWHIRYVGTELSQELHKQNISTLEEFFGIVPDKQPY